MQKVLLASVLIPTLTAVAHAQSVSRTMQDFGLVGTWAVDCKDLPSPRNEYSSYTVSAFGDVQLRNDFGHDYDDMVYQIVDARPVGSDRLALRQVLTTDRQIVLDTVIVKSNDRVRVWSSRGLDGRTLVWDGTISMANGHATRWVVRCDERRADDRVPDADSQSGVATIRHSD